jgi:hypothetical protein
MTTTSTGITETYTPKQRRLIERYRDINTDYDWWDCTYDHFIEKAAAKGFETDAKSIQFSGFWSQGDGASFTGDVDVPAFIKAHKLESAYPWIMKLYEHGGDIYAKVYRISHHYVHENTCRAVIPDWDQFVYLLDTKGDDTRYAVIAEWDKHLQSDIDQLEKDIESTRLELCRELYDALETEYEHLTSDEVVWDTIEANDLHNQEEDDDQ